MPPPLPPCPMLVGGALCGAEPSSGRGPIPPPPPSLSRACHGSSNVLPPLPLGSGSCITFMVTMPWALWASYRSESPADMPGGLCPWDGPPKDSPSIHPSIHPMHHSLPWKGPASQGLFCGGLLPLCATAIKLSVMLPDRHTKRLHAGINQQNSVDKMGDWGWCIFRFGRL